eukprot:11957371-Ditylum_brightwellii.AAC.1
MQTFPGVAPLLQLKPSFYALHENQGGATPGKVCIAQQMVIDETFGLRLLIARCKTRSTRNGPKSK